MNLLRQFRSFLSGNRRIWMPSLAYTFFKVRFRNCKLPEFELGPVGSELACYVPDGIPWRQINYGQGEGQIEIEGREWSFYLDPGKGELHIYLEFGEIPISDAVHFVNAVAAKVSGTPGLYEINLHASRPSPPPEL